MRDPKNAFAAASTSSGDSVARWKYFTARLHVTLCFVPRLRNAERGSGGEAPQGPKAPQGKAVQHDAEARPRHRGAREHGRQQHPEERIQRARRDGNPQRVVEERPEEVDPDRPYRALRQLNGGDDAAQVAADE